MAALIHNITHIKHSKKSGKHTPRAKIHKNEAILGKHVMRSENEVLASKHAKHASIVTTASV